MVEHLQLHFLLLQAAGDEVSFIDQGYDFNTNALTVGRNGSNIANAVQLT